MRVYGIIHGKLNDRVIVSDDLLNLVHEIPVGIGKHWQDEIEEVAAIKRGVNESYPSELEELSQ